MPRKVKKSAEFNENKQTICNARKEWNKSSIT